MNYRNRLNSDEGKKTAQSQVRQILPFCAAGLTRLTASTTDRALNGTDRMELLTADGKPSTKMK